MMSARATLNAGAVNRPTPVPRVHGLRKTAGACPAVPTLTKKVRVAPCQAFNQDTLVGVAAAVAGLACGIGIPIFFEVQAKNSAERVNNTPCFACKGTGRQSCKFCDGDGKVTVALGNGTNETSTCVNCEGSGIVACSACSGSGIQARYLDRREFKDDD
eukprot:jgi/Mesvir1/10554/Mv21781-RA.1